MAVRNVVLWNNDLLTAMKFITFSSHLHILERILVERYAMSKLNY